MLPKKKMRQVYYDYDHGVHIVVLVPNVFNLRHTPPQADSESQDFDKRRYSLARSSNSSSSDHDPCKLEIAKSPLYYSCILFLLERRIILYRNLIGYSPSLKLV